MDQSIFANVQIARARSTVPLVGQAPGEVPLKHVIVGVREEATRQSDNPVVHLSMAIRQRGDLAMSVVNQSARCVESKGEPASCDRQRILGVPDGGAEDSVDVDVELRVC